MPALPLAHQPANQQHDTATAEVDVVWQSPTAIPASQHTERGPLIGAKAPCTPPMRLSGSNRQDIAYLSVCVR